MIEMGESSKGSKFHWNGDLHVIFLEALGKVLSRKGRLTPNKVLEEMEVDGLTQLTVADVESHLEMHLGNIQQNSTQDKVGAKKKRKERKLNKPLVALDVKWASWSVNRKQKRIAKKSIATNFTSNNVTDSAAQMQSNVQEARMNINSQSIATSPRPERDPICGLAAAPAIKHDIRSAPVIEDDICLDLTL